MTIEIKLYGDIVIHSKDWEVKVKRKFLWNSKIELEFYKYKTILLKTEYYSLLPSGNIKITYQNLKNTISCKKIDGKSSLITKNFIYQIEYKSIFSRRSGKVFCNNQVIGSVTTARIFSMSSFIFELNLEQLDQDAQLYVAILFVLNNQDIDGD